jgi:hypothetical protein
LGALYALRHAPNFNEIHLGESVILKRVFLAVQEHCKKIWQQHKGFYKHFF